MDAIRETIARVLDEALREKITFTAGEMKLYLRDHYQLRLDAETCLKYMNAIMDEKRKKNTSRF